MAPTYELGTGFAREFARLSREQSREYRQAVEKFVDALRWYVAPNDSLPMHRKYTYEA
jgi:hypothetical protein